MDLAALLKTIILSLIAVIIESFSATEEDKRWFRNLQQPKHSFPFIFWYVVGGFYYMICGIIAYREFYNATEIFILPIILLALIMILNSLANFILFKFRSLKAFYWFLVLLTLLFIGLISTLYQTDKMSAWFAGMYLLWLCYDIYYFRQLWRINECKTTMIKGKTTYGS